MLHSLYVRNLAVLAEASVDFGPGLNVLTGETGAGKSIVVDSLALLAGARASTELIRGGASGLTVTGIFRPEGERWLEPLAAAGLAVEGGELVIRREIGRQSANRIFVNDQPVTLRLLGELAPSLLRIHTQQEELSLLTADTQREWLDRSGGDEAAALRLSVAERYEAYRGLAARLDRLRGDERLRRERLDLLRFHAAEIDAAELQAGEEEELRRERLVLRHAESIRSALGNAVELLLDAEGAAVDRLAQARRQLEAIGEWEPAVGEWSAELSEVKIRVEELAAALRHRLDGIDAAPGRLDRVEERLALLDRLCRKLGRTSGEILAYRQEVEAELEELTSDAENRGQLERRVEEALADYRSAAVRLSQRRASWAESLIERVHAELADLAMRRARFGVRLERQRREDSPLALAGEPVEFSAEGFDQVRFQLAANVGEEMGPLARVASGGELSRVYLAVQLAVRGEGAAMAPSLVFDEVDSGVGGAEAASLGRKLKRLAGGGQVLVVTHLPQVASFADRHFRVSKRVVKGRTHTAVASLDSRARVEEVARMLAGKRVTELSLSHAEELIAASERQR